MDTMTAIQAGLFILVIYICVYGIVNRICTCIEHCATGKAYQTAINNAATTNKQQNETEVK